MAKLADDAYVEWSTVVDAPVTYVMTRREMHEYVLREYGRMGIGALNEAELARLDGQHGTTSQFTSLAEILGYNRAGNLDEHLSTVEALLARYRRGVYEPKPPQA